MADAEAPRSWLSRAAPGLVLMTLAPMVAEVLPGATRISSIFVLPIEIAVWGGGALIIRALVSGLGLGWRNMLLLALALAVAEEFIIQQTSVAPMVLQLKGETYARAFGVNYVYLAWALVYEAVLVVFVPIQLTQLLFPSRRGAWLGKISAGIIVLLFGLGAFLAWFSWTQYARANVFHVPQYDPPLAQTLGAYAAVLVLIGLAIGPLRRLIARESRAMPAPHVAVVGVAAFIWAVLWYGLCLLGFGIAPRFPPAAALAGAFALVAAMLYLLPRWRADARWRELHDFSLVLGAMTGSMLIGFVGFIGAAPIDLYGKLALNVIALVLLLWLGAKVRTRSAQASQSGTVSSAS